MPPVDPELAIARFGKSSSAFSRSAAGKEVLADLKKISPDLAGAGQPARPDLTSLLSAGRLEPGAVAAGKWIARMPPEVAKSDLGLIDPGGMTAKTRHQTLAAGVGVLDAGLRAILSGVDEAKDDGFADKLIRTAFGNDKVANVLRKPFLPSVDTFPFDIPKGLDIDRLVRQGALGKAFVAFGACASSTRDAGQRLGPPEQLGRVIAISPNPCCPGDMVTISFAGLGATAPKLTDGASLILGWKVSDATRLLNLDRLAPDWISEPWSDRRELTFRVPDDAENGLLGLIYLPALLSEATPSCMIEAVGAIQGAFELAGIGALGAQLGSSISVAIAGSIAQTIANLPAITVSRQADGANLLKAGPPRIVEFVKEGTGPLYPGNRLQLRWSARNCENLEIKVRNVVGGARHELPDLSGTRPNTGALDIIVNCSAPWSADIVLVAKNSNPCMPTPAERVIRVESGFGEWKVGAGRAGLDFDPGTATPPYRLAGFANEVQIATSVAHPIFVRAFVAEEIAVAGPKCVCVVVADIWTCTIAIRSAVIGMLERRLGRNVFTDENLLIAGTHTHSAPGGYSDYHLYNLSIGGFDQRVFDEIVTKICTAVMDAWNSRRPGEIRLANGLGPDCGVNRSIEAFRRNDTGGTGDDLAVDRQMTLLSFRHHDQLTGIPREVGRVNWFALHPTNLGYMNRAISGDNKGWAETLSESRNPAVVSAFANGASGDTSCNIPSGIPMGGPHDQAALDRDMARLKDLGQLQHDAAEELVARQMDKVTGAIACRSCWRDFSGISIRDIPGGRTAPAALGVSFGAGSSEDSEPAVYLPVPDPANPTKMIANIKEGIDQKLFDQGAVDFWLMGGGLGLAVVITIAVGALGTLGFLLATPGIAASFVTSMGLVFGSLLAFKAVIEALPASPGTSWFFATLGKMFFASKVPAPNPSNGGTWAWQHPDLVSFPPDLVRQHAPKPIMFRPGDFMLQFTPDRGGAASLLACPLVPHVLPLQLLRIGQVILVAIPGELTAFAGKMLRETIEREIGEPGLTVVLSTYTNGYCNYITTAEEYGAQHYEGASTLYGPHTLSAFQQEFSDLGKSLANGSPLADKGAPFTVPARVERPS